MLRDFNGGCISDNETKTINNIFKKYNLLLILIQQLVMQWGKNY